MARNFIKYVLVVFLIIITSDVTFGEGVGTTTASFLKMGVGARAIGMGGAFVAISDDANATYWNPAGLTQIKSPEISGTHNQWFEDIRSEYISYVKPLSGKLVGVAGVDIIYMTVADIEKRDAAGDKAGTVKVNNLAYALSYGYELNSTLSVGAKLKGIFQEYGDDKGNGVAADVGLLWIQPVIKEEKLSFGLNVQNIGPKIKTASEKEKLPFNIKGGIALTSPKRGVILAADMDKPVDNKMRLHAGIEYAFRKIIALRFGYQDVGDLGSGSGFTAGCGFKGYETEEFNNVLIQFDYALVSFGDFGYTHRFSLAVKF